MSYFMYNKRSCLYAHRDSKGQHDGLTTANFADAKTFDTFGAAAIYSQNFGDAWGVKETPYVSSGWLQATDQADEAERSSIRRNRKDALARAGIKS